MEVDGAYHPSLDTGADDKAKHPTKVTYMIVARERWVPVAGEVNSRLAGGGISCGTAGARKDQSGKGKRFLSYAFSIPPW